MYSYVLSALIQGIESNIVRVEADVSDGLPGFAMVGDLSMRVREAQNRVTTAFRNTGMKLMAKRVTVNLAPADVHKDGAGFDLPIAVAVLGAYRFPGTDIDPNGMMVGELSLDGSVKGVRGILPMVKMARDNGMHYFVLPEENRAEGEAIKGIQIIGVTSLADVLRFLKDPSTMKKPEKRSLYIEETPSDDFGNICGQEPLKRAVEIAVAGRHNLLMSGPPGAGKSMAAKCIPGILPQLSVEESLELSAIYSVAGLLKENGEILRKRPFRAPHHTITPMALAGGGKIPRPGEVSLAHKGVLFLDELPEFQGRTLEILRQPLEEKKILISRNQGNICYPADCMLVAAMNPCKCGYYPDLERCTCTESEIRKYLGKISRPLLDRIDICVEVSSVSFGELTERRKHESSVQIRERIMAAWMIQQERYRDDRIQFNCQLDAEGVQKYCVLDEEQRKIIKDAYQKMRLSARAYHRILKVARTIADLSGNESIKTEYLYEAIAYRNVDRNLFTEGEWK